MGDTTTFNEEAARKLADEKGFEPEKMMFCPECGRTVIRTQKMGNPGMEDNIFCTCESYGPPMFSVEQNDD